jgi:hypothetical protein
VPVNRQADVGRVGTHLYRQRRRPTSGGNRICSKEV